MPLKNRDSAVTAWVLVPGVAVNSGSCLKPAARCARRFFSSVGRWGVWSVTTAWCPLIQKTPLSCRPERRGRPIRRLISVCACVCVFVLSRNCWAEVLGFPPAPHLLVPLNRKTTALWSLSWSHTLRSFLLLNPSLCCFSSISHPSLIHPSIYQNRPKLFTTVFHFENSRATLLGENIFNLSELAESNSDRTRYSWATSRESQPCVCVFQTKHRTTVLGRSLSQQDAKQNASVPVFNVFTTKIQNCEIQQQEKKQIANQQSCLLQKMLYKNISLEVRHLLWNMDACSRCFV